ncbi:Mor transcription activator family protein [Sulfurimonas sp.]
MSAITNYDLFEELYAFIENPNNDINATIKEFGGSSFYIPSYKTTIRNDEIIEKYKQNLGQTGYVKKLAREYDLSEAQVYAITKDVREPGLF